MAESKPKTSDALRVPKPKKKLGLSVRPAIRLPHEDLIQAQHSNALSSMPSQTSPTSMSSQTSHTSINEEPQPTTLPVSPSRDFTKVANSIGREAVPAGLFTGKSKQLYDCLYSLTRGAVAPTRTIRISRPKLMKKAGIGARVTFDANVERLVMVGLVQVRQIAGEHEGNEYTVLLPEELSQSSMASLTSQTSLTSHAQKLVRLVRLETSQTRHTLSPLNSTVSALPKTFIKTIEKNDDDEAFADFLAALKKASKEITGREVSASEKQNWAVLADVLVAELKMAAGRTEVSSVPAFLAEHLRRRLWKRRQKETEAEQPQDTAASQLGPELDASGCPDCYGTGMYYPEGFDKGVAKCSHPKLRSV
jgi:hypothetical protein